MSIQQLVVVVKQFFQEVIGREGHIIGANHTEEGWIVQVETVEDSDYMRKRALDDVMGLYEVKLNDQFEILGYQRMSLRARDDFEDSTEE